MKRILLLCLMVSAFSAYGAGGDRVGNGGDVVVCENSVELLDIYEARVKGYEFIKLKENEPLAMLEELFKTNLQDFQSIRAKSYREYAKDFFKEAQMLPNIHLNDVNDSGLVAIPKGCKLEQIVVQLATDDIAPDGYRYTFSRDLWDKLDNFNRMALLLHEIIYREAIETKKFSSMSVRAMVGQLLKNNPDYEILLELTSSLVTRSRYVIAEYFDAVIGYYPNTKLNFKRITSTKQDILRLYSPQILFWHSHEEYSKDKNRLLGSTLDFDCKTKKLVQIERDKEIVGKLVDAGESFQASARLTITPNQKIFLRSATSKINWAGPDPLNMTVKITSENYQVEKIELQNISELTYYDSHQYADNYLKGKFDFISDLYVLEKSEIHDNTFFFPRNSRGFKTHKRVHFTDHLGDFYCKEYFNYKTYENQTYADCGRTEQPFKLNLSGRIIPAMFDEQISEVRLYSNGSPEYEKINLYVTEKTFLGKTKGFRKKDVYIEPGNYTLSGVTIFNQNIKYILWDEWVEVQKQSK